MPPLTLKPAARPSPSSGDHATRSSPSGATVRPLVAMLGPATGAVEWVNTGMTLKVAERPVTRAKPAGLITSAFWSSTLEAAAPAIPACFEDALTGASRPFAKLLEPTAAVDPMRAAVRPTCRVLMPALVRRAGCKLERFGSAGPPPPTCGGERSNATRWRRWLSRFADQLGFGGVQRPQDVDVCVDLAFDRDLDRRKVHLRLLLQVDGYTFGA